MELSFVFWFVIAFGVLPIAIIGIVLLLGYGGSMLTVAGYYAMTEEQRRGYDAKRILRIAGAALLLMAALLAVFFYMFLQDSVGVVTIVFIPLLPLLIVIPLMNSKFSKVKKHN